jgi:murein hydrolase activator
VNGVSVETIIAVAAAAASALCVVASVLILVRVRGRARILETEIERGKREFDAVVEHEVSLRTEELEATLARLRAEALSELAAEERRIADERRREVADREREATAQLGHQLVTAQQAVEQRLSQWASDVDKLQEGLAAEIERIEARQRHLMTEVESRIGRDAESLNGEIDQQKQLLARLREELSKAALEASQAATAEVEAHAAERRRALHEVSDRLRRREVDLRDLIDREGSEATSRIQIALGDIERRQVEQLQRVVDRAAARYSEAAQQQFDTTIRSAREEAARRLSRELDLAVERFAREAEAVLTERLNQTGDAAAARVEERLSRLRGNLERRRDDALRSLEERAHAVETSLRDRLREIASDAEAERAVIETRLLELARRIEEQAARL